MLVCLYPQNMFMYSSVSQPLITTYQGMCHNMLTVLLLLYSFAILAGHDNKLCHLPEEVHQSEMNSR